MSHRSAPVDVVPPAAEQPFDAPPLLQHEEALARCEFLIQERRPLGVVGGGSGAGKSRLLRTLQGRGRSLACTPAALVDMTAADGLHLLRELADGWGLASRSRDRFELLRGLRDRCLGDAACGVGQLVLLDHLDQAAPDAFDLIRSLLNITAPSRALTVIAASRQPLPSLLQWLLADFGSIRIELGRLGPNETAEFVRATLDQFGREEVAIRPAALSELQRLSAGQARQLERLCELAALASTVEGTDILTPELIRAAHWELPETLTTA